MKCRRTMTATTQLTPTEHASKEEYYIADDQTCRCGRDHPHLIGRNGSKGQRTTDYVCEECLEDMENAPRGLYDPVVLAKNPNQE